MEDRIKDPSVESLMPKGVEHLVILFRLVAIIGVESLMPKGVEHERLNTFLLLMHSVLNL